MEPSHTGEAYRRREDPELVTGTATYTDDLTVPGMAHAAILRSQYGHADLAGVDTAAAAAMDGVVAVFTGEDVADDDAPGVLETPGVAPNAVETPLPIVATDRVRYTGEPVAIVVAEDRYTAHDALDAIEVEYDRRDAVVDAEAALEDVAPTVHDHAVDNVAFDWTFGDAEAVEEALEDAAVTATVSLRNQRLIGDPMEPRVALAAYDGARLTLTVSSQTPHQDKAAYAATLGLDEDDVRIVSPAVGGGFGIKGEQYPDEALTAWSAMQLGRPVKWTATRSETHVTDNQSRDWYLDGEIALDPDGLIRGVKLDARHTVGAYYRFAPTLASNFEKLIQGQYEIPAIAAHIVGSFTNTTPIGPYRGAGRPEVIYFLERLVDAGAREAEIDPAELRRRNLIPANAFPYETTLGNVYDSGDYERSLDVALEAADYDGWRRRQAERREAGRYVGIGLCGFVENSGSSPGMGETATVELADDGTATAFLGTHDHGQGHATTFSQVLADAIGYAYDDIEIIEGDTADLPDGIGTFGSRSATLGGGALNDAAMAVVEAACELAADRLEAPADDVAFDDGSFHIAGAPDRAVELTEIARERVDAGDPLSATRYYDPPNYGWTFGTHVAVVEVEPTTGEVDFLDYVAVEDCGVVINPLVVRGQLHGGVAQGVGQALYEAAVYDDTGTLLTGSLQDYALPKSQQLPEVRTFETETPSPHNPLGVKGTGESGTIAATPAVANAVADALEPFGVDDVPLPMTPEAVWQAVHGDG